MCCSTSRLALRTTRHSETWQIQAPGEVLGRRLRHWGQATLELRRVRKGSARIHLRGNPARANIGKAPKKESQEPDSATTRLSTPLSTKGGKTSKVVGAVGARGILKHSISKVSGKVSREFDSAVARPFLPLNTGGISKVVGVLGVIDTVNKTLSPPLPSANILQGRRLSLEEEKRDKEVIDRQDKIQGKTSDLSNCLFKFKKRGSEGRPGKKHNNKLAPSLRAYFKTRPEDIVLVPGQGKMDTYMTKYTRNDADSGEGGTNDPPPLTNNSAHQVDKQVGLELLLRQDGNLQEVGVVVETPSSPPFSSPGPRPKT
ncbi:hypothetical protein NDU88_003551 [Pleurodeles waltl]|uniref:Uncharacterized protein n=1 Tax=Pleurodeles waltl TaxID=8319 RepID=A0AAV7TQ19_PLEWA|nr:hypothetical protein NDU88_003551 [Pleurodeles waltl]